MNVFQVGFRYTPRNTRRVTRSHVFVIADSEFDAKEAFLASHKTDAGSYEIAYVTHTES